jgi:quercetin dioxygenase-like cupin family protein
MSEVIQSIESTISQLKVLAKDLARVEMPTKHFLVDEMYLRHILIPMGTAFVGRRHKKPHYFLVLKGGAWITSEGEPQNFQAGMVFMCEPGSRRIGLTYADTIFVTIHRTSSQTLPEIEDDCVEFDPTDHYGVGNEPLYCLPEKPL